MNVQALQVKHNQDANRFEVQLGDKFGVLEYHKDGLVYSLVHTEVPKEFEGQGIATHLVHEALEQIKAEGGKIVPICPFVLAFLRRYPEYRSLVAHSSHD